MDGQKEDKAGTMFKETVKIEVRGNTLPYVSRGLTRNWKKPWIILAFLWMERYVWMLVHPLADLQTVCSRMVR